MDILDVPFSSGRVFGMARQKKNKLYIDLRFSPWVEVVVALGLRKSLPPCLSCVGGF